MGYIARGVLSCDRDLLPSSFVRRRSVTEPSPWDVSYRTQWAIALTSCDEFLTGPAVCRRTGRQGLRCRRATSRTGRRLKGLAPGQFWEANDPSTVVRGVLQQWFEDGDKIEALLESNSGSVGDRESIKYRVKVRNNDGSFEVEQQAYYETDGERITMMRVLCSGFRPTA